MKATVDTSVLIALGKLGYLRLISGRKVIKVLTLGNNVLQVCA